MELSGAKSVLLESLGRLVLTRMNLNSFQDREYVNPCLALANISQVFASIELAGHEFSIKAIKAIKELNKFSQILVKYWSSIGHVLAMYWSSISKVFSKHDHSIV